MGKRISSVETTKAKTMEQQSAGFRKESDAAKARSAPFLTIFALFSLKRVNIFLSFLQNMNANFLASIKFVVCSKQGFP